MDVSKRQDDAGRRLAGFVVVILLHVGLVYALLNGLAQEVVEVAREPVVARLIEEIKPPPPPPPPTPPPPQEVVAPPPKVKPPPRPFVPPPEVAVAAPPLVPPAITAVSPTPSPVPYEPPAPPPPEPMAASAPAAAARPAGPVSAGIACSKTPMPMTPSVTSEVRGSLYVLGTIRNGRVVKVEIERNTLTGATDRRTLRALVTAIETTMKDGYVCTGDDVQIRQEFIFRLE